MPKKYKQQEDSMNKINEVAFAAKSNYNRSQQIVAPNFCKKTRPQGTCCNIPEHTKKKCCKFHVYRSGYKPKSKKKKKSEEVLTN